MKEAILAFDTIGNTPLAKEYPPVSGLEIVSVDFLEPNLAHKPVAKRLNVALRWGKKHKVDRLFLWNPDYAMFVIEQYRHRNPPFANETITLLDSAMPFFDEAAPGGTLHDALVQIPGLIYRYPTARMYLPESLIQRCSTPSVIFGKRVMGYTNIIDDCRFAEAMPYAPLPMVVPEYKYREDTVVHIMTTCERKLPLERLPYPYKLFKDPDKNGAWWNRNRSLAEARKEKWKYLIQMDDDCLASLPAFLGVYNCEKDYPLVCPVSHIVFEECGYKAGARILRIDLEKVQGEFESGWRLEDIPFSLENGPVWRTQPPLLAHQPIINSTVFKPITAEEAARQFFLIRERYNLDCDDLVELYNLREDGTL